MVSIILGVIVIVAIAITFSEQRSSSDSPQVITGESGASLARLRYALPAIPEGRARDESRILSPTIAAWRHGHHRRRCRGNVVATTAETSLIVEVEC